MVNLIIVYIDLVLNSLFKNLNKIIINTKQILYVEYELDLQQLLLILSKSKIERKDITIIITAINPSWISEKYNENIVVEFAKQNYDLKYEKTIANNKGDKLDKLIINKSKTEGTTVTCTFEIIDKTFIFKTDDIKYIRMRDINYDA